jgi:MOSC domain-containing protein YiiM
MTPLLKSLNVGLPTRIASAKPWKSGIYKDPVLGRIHLSSENLAGDGQADLTVHGGPDKAVCVYSVDHYPLWREELGVEECGPGWFGENFSIEGHSETHVAIGDTYRVGTAVVQISQPRAPCSKLGRRWNRLDMPKLVIESGRTGWYLRVIEPGDVEQGDALTLVERPFPQWTIDVVNGVAYSRGGTDIEGARQLSNCSALAEAWRAGFRSV